MNKRAKEAQAKEAQITFRTRRITKQALEQLARKDRRTIAFLINEAVEDYLKRRGVYVAPEEAPAPPAPGGRSKRGSSE